ncbi:MAG: hypothetical protein NZ556_00475 [Fimbriimonadales bacterium]|nr:hypothetical protein [Fimbriimonadales bacterium]
MLCSVGVSPTQEARGSPKPKVAWTVSPKPQVAWTVLSKHRARTRLSVLRCTG